MGTSPRGQYSRKIRFIEKPGVKDEGVAICLNVVLTPASLPRGKFVLSDPRGGGEMSTL